jgi:cold shock CspA family protein
MDLPLEITLRDVSPYEAAVEEEIRRRAEKLGRLRSDVLRCRVVVESPHRHRRRGAHYNVCIELSLPHKKILVNHEHNERRTHEDINLAVRDAFDSVTRRLEEHVHRLHGEIKFHESPHHGRVLRLFPTEGYGFIETPGGGEVYFHRNSVLGGDFRKLKLGSEVRFSEEDGEEGPQASSVRLVGKHHILA